MHRYGRLWLRFVAIALIQEFEYRINFVINVFISLLSLSLAILTYNVLFSYTDAVAGWTQAEVLMVLGCFRMLEGLIEVLIARNLWNVTNYIREGDMDYLLTRPASSQFMATLRIINLTEIANVLIGLGLIMYAGQKADVVWRLPSIGAAIIFGACGLTMLYAVWCAAVSCSFWFIGGPLDTVIHWFMGTGQYPVTFFKGWIRFFLTFVFPIAFATTFPVQALRGEIDPRMLLTAVVLAATALLASSRFWNYGVRHYSSASS